MWGINHTVRELAHISQPVMLMPDDFRAFTKIKVDNFAFNKENLPSHFKVSPLISTALWYKIQMLRMLLDNILKKNNIGKLIEKIDFYYYPVARKSKSR